MSILAIAPALLAMLWLARSSCRKAYLDIYLFTLFALPGWCRFIAPGTPDPTFHEAAVLPISIIYLWKYHRKWHYSITDCLVVLYACQIGYSEYDNAGYKEAQNLLFDLIAAGLLPYLLAKGLLKEHSHRVDFVKRLVWLVACLVFFFAIEARLGFNPYRFVFDRFFPGQGDGWVTTFRYGLARAAGPYGHAILAGIVLLIAFHLHRWLNNGNYWEGRVSHVNLPGLTKSKTLTIILFAGLALTMVRGPQIGAVIAAAVSFIGAGPNPRRRAGWVALAILVVGVPAGIIGYSYASVGRAAATTTSQESAAYRKELIDKYVDVALERSALGWGRNGWPKVAGMPSIDNYYLLLALMHGVPATALLLLILVVMIARLLRNGMKAGMLKPKGSSLSFRLAGIYAGFAFSVLTVYMGDNVIPIFFTMLGFADNYLCSGGDLALLKPQTCMLKATPKPSRFDVVLA